MENQVDEIQVQLEEANNDAVEEFTVEMQVQYWTPIG